MPRRNFWVGSLPAKAGSKLSGTRHGGVFIFNYHLSTDERKAIGVKELPGSLAEALGELDKDEVLKKALGQTIYEAFCRARLSEWDEYCIHVTDWEVERYLETA